MKRYFTLFACTFFLVNCGENQAKSLETVFPTAAKCDGQSVENTTSYVALWEDGSITKESAPSRDELAQKFVKPHLQKLKLVEPNYKFKIETNLESVKQNDTVAYADNWGPARVQAEAFWVNNNYGNNIVVAVIDSGVDRTHTQLKNRIHTNTAEIPNNGIDDDKNGYIDDVNGWDFVENSNNVFDYNGHGTHVAGIIAADHSDKHAQAMPYVQGVAPRAKILPLAFLNEEGMGSLSSALAAIRYAIQQNAKVINASWGGSGCSSILQQEIIGLAAKNIYFVAASGNGDHNGLGINLDRFPNQFPAVINGASQFTVGAVGIFDSMTVFSNYGRNYVHLFAPGQNIISTVPGGMASLSGTSMATPFVSGALALILNDKPNITPAEARQIFYSSAFKSGTYLNASQGRMDLPGVKTALGAMH